MENNIWWNPKNLKQNSEEYRNFVHTLSDDIMKEVRSITRNHLDATNYTRFLDYFHGTARDRWLYYMHVDEGDRWECNNELFSEKTGKITFSLFGDQMRILDTSKQKGILTDNGILFLNEPIEWIFMGEFEEYGEIDDEVDNEVWELLKKVEIAIGCENKYRLVILMCRENRDNKNISAQLLITNGQSKDELTQLFLQDTEFKRDESDFFFIFPKSKDEPIQKFAPDKEIEIDSSNCSYIILESEDELIKFCKLLKCNDSKK